MLNNNTIQMLNVCEKGITWKNLRGVFKSNLLAKKLVEFDSRFNVVDETQFFARLVNMSTASAMPFHKWLRYREGYSGDLVKELLLRWPVDPRKEFVIDPMCGSGSTLVACRENGVDALGLDVNAYAVLCGKVKTFYYDLEAIRSISHLISSLRAPVKKNDVIPNENIKSLEKYFPAGNLLVLNSLYEWVNNIKEVKIREFFFLALLACLEDCSNRKKDGNGLATRPAICNDPQKRFLCQLEIMFEDIRNSQPKFKPFIQSYDESALSLMHATKKFALKVKKTPKAIIFSPPYANSFDYFESYKLELIFGQFVLSSRLHEARKRLIRNYRLGYGHELETNFELVEMICKEIWSSIPEKEAETGIRDGRTRLVPNMLRGYFEDMRSVIAQGFESLAPDGTMHIVVDQSAYVGIPVPTDLFLAAIGEECGFRVEQISVCRKANTSGQQLKKFPYLKTILRESIVTLRKPN